MVDRQGLRQEPLASVLRQPQRGRDTPGRGYARGCVPAGVRRAGPERERTADAAGGGRDPRPSPLCRPGPWRVKTRVNALGAPGPILRSSSRGHGVWAPAFAGATPDYHGRMPLRIRKGMRFVGPYCVFDVAPPRSFLAISPPFITNLTRSISLGSTSGLPETAMR